MFLHTLWGRSWHRILHRNFFPPNFPSISLSSKQASHGIMKSVIENFYLGQNSQFLLKSRWDHMPRTLGYTWFTVSAVVVSKLRTPHREEKYFLNTQPPILIIQLVIFVFCFHQYISINFANINVHKICITLFTKKTFLVYAKSLSWIWLLQICSVSVPHLLFHSLSFKTN